MWNPAFSPILTSDPFLLALPISQASAMASASWLNPLCIIQTRMQTTYRIHSPSGCHETLTVPPHTSVRPPNRHHIQGLPGPNLYMCLASHIHCDHIASQQHGQAHFVLGDPGQLVFSDGPRLRQAGKNLVERIGQGARWCSYFWGVKLEILWAEMPHVPSSQATWDKLWEPPSSHFRPPYTYGSGPHSEPGSSRCWALRL